MDPLFPEIPEDLTVLSDEELEDFKTQHEIAAEKIEAEDEEYIKGMSAADVLAALETGAEQFQRIRDEQKARIAAQEEYLAAKAEKLAAMKDEEVEEAAEDEEEAEEAEDSEELTVVAETEVELTEDDEKEEEDEAEEPEKKSKRKEEAVVASAERDDRSAYERSRMLRPPTPSQDRTKHEKAGVQLVAAAGLQTARAGQPFTPESLAKAMSNEAKRWGTGRPGIPERYLVARADAEFPEELQLRGDPASDGKKIKAIIPNTVSWGEFGGAGLTASGGLCAPLTPLYDMPNFASDEEPVWGALPKFQATRGGVSVPEATVIGDITSAISNIDADDDALGGTFATKSCQDLDCVQYTDVAVQILAHCREYGNLNAMAWPEKLEHENALTMAALARTSETFMLDRIKALSVSVTAGAETLGALIYLVDSMVKATFGIRSRLRMSRNARFRALLPAILPDFLLLDTVSTPYDRFRTQDQLVSYLRGVGIEPTFYLDSPSDGVSQIADSTQAAGALDGLPDKIQYAIFPEGAFIGVDSGALELGVVRDSVLNATNDFQIFGERFRNVARIAPAQAAYWVEVDICPTGQFPPAGTARTCE